MDFRRILGLVALIVLFMAALWVYRVGEKPRPQAAAVPTGTPVQIASHLGLPPVPYPPDNPPTVETIALGKRLYYDPILSVDNTVSCASCHSPDHGFADDSPVSQGVQKKTGTRNSPTVLNSAFLETQFWDGRAPSLEKQAEGPVENPVEMAHTLKDVEQKLMADPSYRAEFAKAFGPGPITYEMVEKAIATFERTVISGNSPFDRWYYGKDEKALSPAAKRGFEVFNNPSKGNCAACHSVGERHALFTDHKFHNVGVGVKNEVALDVGRYAVTKNEADRGAFRTPTLRNIALTPPYMHDGSLKTLKEVVDFYIGGGNSNPNRDPLIKPLDFLSGQERADLMTFLESLTGNIPEETKAPQQKAEK